MQLNNGSYIIENTLPEDIDFICLLFEEGIAWQRSNNHVTWNGYDRDAFLQEIDKGRQYKIVSDGVIVAVFSVYYNDPVIWREMDKGDALYMHRIVVNQQYKGQRQFERILSWAKAEAIKRKRSYIRMDTWGDNQAIVEYYKRYGFKLVEYYTTPDTPELTFPYRNLYLALLELSL